MSDQPDNFSQLVDTFCGMVDMAHESDLFAAGLCGPRSLLVQVMTALLSDAQPDQASVKRFETCLDALNRLIGSGKMPSLYRQDGILPERWAGLSELIRSRLVERSSPRFGECLKNAKDSFDKVWRDATLGAHLRSPPIADCTTAKTADKGLFLTVNDYLQPWTPGSWMVWDVFSQWNQKANPVAVETTPVLFAGGSQGQVMRLVVEALPGPPGFVTPNWWRLGLCAFKTGNPTRFLLPAVQRVIGFAAATGAGLRFRWHLDADERDAWKLGLDGRSVEAAAAVATLAALERYQELKDSKVETTKSEPILDTQAVVTGVVATNGSSSPCDFLLEPVSKETLGVKLAAAKIHGLDVIGVPAAQAMDGVEPSIFSLSSTNSSGCSGRLPL